MQVNRIQNNTAFGAKIVPNKTFSDFARAAAKTRTKIYSPEYRCSFNSDVESRFNDAITKLRNMHGDKELEMYSRAEHDLETNMGYGQLGFRNLSTGKEAVTTGPIDDPYMKKAENNNVMEGFIRLVNKIENMKEFWEGTPEADFENSIINRLTK